jgi:predicted permease
MDGNAIIQEWARRRRLYRDKTRGYNRVALWVALPALAVTFIGPREIAPIAGCLFLGAIIVVAAAWTIFTEKYLKCPNCARVPAQFRGNALGATTCPYCRARLEADLLPDQ